MTITLTIAELFAYSLVLIFNLFMIACCIKSLVDEYKYNKKIKFEAKLDEYLRRKGLLK